MHNKAFRIPALLAAVAAAFAALPGHAQRGVVSKHVPHIVQNGRATALGVMNRTETLQLTLALPLRNEAQLDTLLADLYNPQSPNFHKWLSQPEFEARFGVQKSDFKTLVRWAQSKSLTITHQAENFRLIDVEGSVDAINQAFNVVETKYHDTYLDRDFHAPDREPTTDLPFDLLDVEGIENSAPIVKHLKRDPSEGIPSLLRTDGGASSGLLSGIATSGAVKGGISQVAEPAPKPRVYGSGPSNSYLPSDMRAAYYGSGNLTGTGQTVGIFSFDGYLTADLQIYYANTGMTSTVPVNNVIANGTGACTATCEDDEQILDIVQVQGMAPGLTQILFYEGTSANTILNKMATDNTAKTISCSWGGGGFGTGSDTYFKQMATQGQSFLSATGDDGGLFKSNYSAPSFDPYITQVGGTDLYTTGPGGAWSSEISWADSGGGFWLTGMSTSAKYTIPTWQTAAVNSSNGASAAYRNVPDFAAEANFDNPTANNGAFVIGYGGTSYAAPRMAGYIALANQQAIANGSTSTGLGLLNPAVYTAGLSSSSASIYHDVTVGSNPAYPATGPTYYAVAGYDLVTGWGSPNGTGLLNYLAGAAVADFGVPANATMSLVRGGSGVTYIPITGYNGFSDQVGVTNYTGLPAGWSITDQLGSAGGNLVLYLGSASTAALGTSYTVTVTLSDLNNAALSHNVNVLVTVGKRSGYDFTMQATAVTLAAGASGTTGVMVTRGAGLPDSINLSVSSVPPGITASFFDTVVPPNASKNALLQIAVAPNVTPNTYYITATGSDAEGITHSVQVPVTVTLPVNLLTNGGFETGDSTGWTFTTVSGTSAVQLLTIASTLPAHLGNYFALLEGGSAAGTDSITQVIRIPSNGHTRAVLSLWDWVLTGQTGTTAVDTMTIQLTDINGNVLTTLGTVSNLNASSYWSQLSYDVSAYIGQKVIVKITATQAGTTYTDFLVDDVSLSLY